MDLRRRLRGPAATRWLVAVGVVLLIHGLAAGSLVLLQRSNAEVVLPGTTVAGTPVGGLEREQLRTAVDAIARRLLDEPVRVTVTARADDEIDAPPDDEAEDTVVTTDHRAVGVQADAATATERVWALGRRGLWRALIDQLRARAGAVREQALPRELDLERLERWSAATAATLSEEPEPAEVELIADSTDDTRLEVTAARPGFEVPAAELRGAVEARYEAPGPLEIRTSRHPVPAPTSDADLDGAVAAADVARSGPVTLRNRTDGADVTLAPAELVAMLEVAFDPDAPDGERLQLVADADALLAHLGDERSAIDIDPEDARVELIDGGAEVVGGTPGFRLDPQGAAEAVLTASLRTSDRQGVLPGTIVTPDATRAAVREALGASGLDVSTPITLHNDAQGEDLELTPPQLTQLLAVSFDPAADPGERLTVTGDDERLLELLEGDALDGIETPPQEPRFDVSDGEVSITDGQPGVALDAALAASRIATLATEPAPRAGELPIISRDPELDNDRARELGIEEEVSSFTTSMVAGQARNNNIRQAADYLDGSLILPGERLSLNDAIGRRTTARGFGEGGFIRDGEIVEVVGGGVSQMATTFMNAAWFAGIELVTFQPHSLYFSQYPVGRESTMSGNTIDVVVENDSPYGILVTTDHSDTHVTVSFWSTPWAEVDTWTGEPTNRVRGALRDGFDVAFGRTITYPDGSTREDTYSHRYRPENPPEG